MYLLKVHYVTYINYCVVYLEPGSHLNANANDAYGSETRQNVPYILYTVKLFLMSRVFFTVLSPKMNYLINATFNIGNAIRRGQTISFLCSNPLIYCYSDYPSNHWSNVPEGKYQ